jgi:NAD+ dependent glucose-6-phosphate dehydrogenase
MAIRKVLITGAAGYVSSRMLNEFRVKYDVVLLDASDKNRLGETVDGVQIVDLIDPDRSKYENHFEGVDAVIHLAHKGRAGKPIDHFFVEKQNVEMAYNVFRCAYDAGVRRVVMATSNHAADWYEHNLIHTRKMDVVAPYDFPLSDNFYGWAKSSQEIMSFLFANGFPSFHHPSGREILVEGINVGRKLEVIMVRIGHPRELDPERYGHDPATFKRVLGCYWSVRDQAQLFTKAIETENIDNEHGVPFHIVYGISNNTRAFWSLSNARKVIDYQPEDDSEVRFAEVINGWITGENVPGGVGRVGLH